MVRHALIAAAVVAGLSVAALSRAEDAGGELPKRETLAERIQRMRSEAPTTLPAQPLENPNAGELRTVMSKPIGHLPSEARNETFQIQPYQLAEAKDGAAPLAPIAEQEPAPLRMADASRPSAVQRTPHRSPATNAQSGSANQPNMIQEKLSELREVLGARPAPRSAAKIQHQPVRPQFDRYDGDQHASRQPAVREARPTPAPVKAPLIETATRPPNPLHTAPSSARRLTQAPVVETPTDEPLADEPLPLAKTPSSRRVAPRTVEKPAHERILLSVQGPQLQARTLGPNRLVVGREAEFTVMVSNDGDSPAEDVLVEVQLPAGVEVVTTTPSRGKSNLEEPTKYERAIQWEIDRLGAGSSETVALRLIPRTAKTVELGVRYTYAQSSNKVQVQVEEPMLSMTISGPNETTYGQTKVYILTLSNPGTGDAENVLISLMPLNGATDATDSHRIGTLRRGETKTVPVELTAAKAGSLEVRARVVAEGGLSASAEKVVLVRRAELEVEAEGPPVLYAGNAATYRLRVTNTGNAAAESVLVSSWLPAGAKFTSASGQGKYDKGEGLIKWELGALAPGETVDFEVRCDLITDGPNQLRVAAIDDTDLTADVLIATSVIGRADLKLVVTDPSGPVPVSDEGAYEIRVRNHGTKAAEAVEVVVFFSEGIEPSRVSGGEHQRGQGQVIFAPIPSLEPGQEKVFTVRAKAGAEGDHVFRAEVVCQSLGARLVAQETTHYYGQDYSATAARPDDAAPAPSGLLKRY